MPHSYTITGINSRLPNDTKLRAVSFSESRIDKRGKTIPIVVCVCICGEYKKCVVSMLIYGHPKSCGCSQRWSRTSHGLAKGHPLYDVWCNIKRRCYKPKTYAYHRYGGRGIIMCEEWKNNFGVFYKWAKDKWKKGLQIDRIDNNGNYEPNNCRFVTASVNGRNKEHCIYLEYEGKKMMINDWAKETGISPNTIYGRYKKGLSPEFVLSTINLGKRF